MAAGEADNKKTWPGSDLPKYCIQAKIEIRKEPEFVKDVLFKNFASVPDWHPGVEKSELNDKCDPVQIGSARKLTFYEGEGNPEFLWEEVVDITDDTLVMIVREENRPSILSYMGPTLRVTAGNKNTTTLVEMAFFYATKVNAVTGFLAKTAMKRALTATVENVLRGIKVHCETGETVTNKTDLPSPVTQKTVTSIYDLVEGENPSRLPDPFDGIERFCSMRSVEISVPVQEVRKEFNDINSCPHWHPLVGYTERKGANTSDGPGAVRKCGFYQDFAEKGAGIPYVWEEIMDVTDNHFVSYIQEENRPSILAFIGKVFKFEAIDENCTRLSVALVYRPTMMPLTRPLATTVMRDGTTHEAYLLCWGVKNYLETKIESNHNDLPELTQFKEGVVDTHSVFVESSDNVRV